MTNRAPDALAQPPLDELTHANRRITVNEMRAELDVGVGALETIMFLLPRPFTGNLGLKLG